MVPTHPQKTSRKPKENKFGILKCGGTAKRGRTPEFQMRSRIDFGFRGDCTGTANQIMMQPQLLMMIKYCKVRNGDITGAELQFSNQTQVEVNHGPIRLLLVCLVRLN
jgi:hypothetical protein